MKLLNNAYVRIEYNEVIWTPEEKIYILMLDKIQLKFASYINVRMDTNHFYIRQ